MSRHIYLLRHGQTQFNAEHRLQGQCDSSLTLQGRQQAQAVGQALAKQIADINDWTMISSPLGRAVETAQYVAAELGYPLQQIQTDPRIQEVALGEWEHAVAPTIKAAHPEFNEMKDWFFQAPGCEPYEQVVQRVGSWLADPALPQRLIVISHGLTGTILRGVLANMSYQQTWQQDRPQDAFYYWDGEQLHRQETTLSIANSAQSAAIK